MKRLENVTITDLRSLKRNEDGNYWLVFDVKGCKNSINPKAKQRDDIIAVGLPKSKLKGFLLSVLERSDLND